MTTTIVTLDQDTVVSEIQIAAPAERVFKALTDPGELPRWFGGPECPRKIWNMDACVGGKYSYTSEMGHAVAKGVSALECHGEILEYDPPRLLVYTWIGSWHEDPDASTVVRWELVPMGADTLVKVTHSGLANLPVARKDYSGGWVGVVEQLKKFLEQ